MLSGIKCDRVPINLNHLTRDFCHFWLSTVSTIQGFCSHSNQTGSYRSLKSRPFCEFYFVLQESVFFSFKLLP